MAPALGDEFEVEIILGQDVNESEFMDGFQLAVDESPDISHPPDTEGGDHLGSMDVTMAVSGSGILPNTGRAPILVVDIPADAIEGSGARSRAMIILFTDAAPQDVPASEDVFAIMREQAERLASTLSPSFETDFAEVHGYRPAPASARGYTAGKLIDIAVEATDRDPTDVAVLRSALEASTSDRATSETTVPSVTSPSSPPTGSDERSLVPPGLIAVIVVVVAIVAAMYVRGSRRNGPPDGP